jgi:hypothetical protein
VSRTLDEVERATDAAARHAWERHAKEGMYAKAGIASEEKLRAHIAAAIRDPATECFRASNDREVYYHRESNTRICLNYREPGTCLIGRSGGKALDKQYTDEFERHINAGQPLEKASPVLTGGLHALHPAIAALERFRDDAMKRFHQMRQSQGIGLGRSLGRGQGDE